MLSNELSRQSYSSGRLVRLHTQSVVRTLAKPPKVPSYDELTSNNSVATEREYNPRLETLGGFKYDAVYRWILCSFAIVLIKIKVIMNDSPPVELRQWADAPYSLIVTPKYQEGKVKLTSAKVAECQNN